MLDPKVVTQMVEEQIAKSVNNQVLEVFTNEELLKPIEEKIVCYIQDRILGKFANSSAVPEIVDAVKQSVARLFDDGRIPGVDQFVDSEKIKQAVDQAVEHNIMTAVENMMKDPIWIERIERTINQAGYGSEVY